MKRHQTSIADIEFEKRREKVDDALMRGPREFVRKKLKLTKSELEDYVGEEEDFEKGNEISGY